MKQTILWVAALVFICGPVVGWAQEADSGQQPGEIVQTQPAAAAPEVIVLEDGTREVVEPAPAEQGGRKIADERIQAVRDHSKAEIAAVIAEIRELADSGDEAELQRKIENIKRDATIARFNIYLQDAETGQDFDRVYEIRDAIDHLENLDEQVPGGPGEQPAPQG